jgi:hypothetical protein
MGQAVEGKGKGKMAQEPVQAEAFPRADLTFDLSDLLPLSDLNEDTVSLPPREIVQIDDDQEQMQPDASMDVQATEETVGDMQRPSKKMAVTVTYERRRSERLKHKLDGVRVDSVDRASQRKASSAGESDSSMGSASSRRRKMRRLPDINKVAPLPITSCPPETDRNRLEMLANCCGFMTLDAVEHALKKMEKNKELPGTGKLNE